MWLFLNNSYVSIVQHRDHREKLIVRGRFEGDVERFLQPALGRAPLKVATTPDADYRFRAIVGRSVVERAMSAAVSGITYPNFKDSIRDAWRKSLALRIWSMLHREQTLRAAGVDDGDAAVQIDLAEDCGRP